MYSLSGGYASVQLSVEQQNELWWGADLLGPRRELAVGARTDPSGIAHADPVPEPGAGGLGLGRPDVLEALDTTSLDDIL